MAATDFESDRAPKRDWFLALLVDHVNEHEGEIPITVSGCVVSGMLVGVREYYERSVDELANVFPTRVEAITEALTAAGEQSVDSVRRHKAQVRAGEAELDPPTTSTSATPSTSTHDRRPRMPSDPCGGRDWKASPAFRWGVPDRYSLIGKGVIGTHVIGLGQP